MSAIAMIRQSARRTGSLLVVVAALTANGCGGSSSGTTDPGSGQQARYYLSASIDGTAWAEDAFSASTTGARNPLAGVYTISGYEPSSATTVLITLYHITVPGTYPLGVDVSGSAGTAQFSNTSSGWSTVVGGSGGTITVTSLTQDEIAGTFTFTAKGILNAPATSIKTVTSGKFDLPVKK